MAALGGVAGHKPAVHVSAKTLSAAAWRHPSIRVCMKINCLQNSNSKGAQTLHKLAVVCFCLNTPQVYGVLFFIVNMFRVAVFVKKI